MGFNGKMTGIDLILRNKDEDATKYINFIEGDAYTYQFNEKFDSIICIYMLFYIESLEKLDQVCQHFYDHLNEGG